MAYSRWGHDSDWYVFWESTKADADAEAAGRAKPKSEELLAIWRARSKNLRSFSYSEVTEMLASEDYSRIPGFDESSQSLLRDWMTWFIQDVDREHDAA